MINNNFILEHKKKHEYFFVLINETIVRYPYLFPNKTLMITLRLHFLLAQVLPGRACR